MNKTQKNLWIEPVSLLSKSSICDFARRPLCLTLTRAVWAVGPYGRRGGTNADQPDYNMNGQNGRLIDFQPKKESKRGVY